MTTGHDEERGEAHPAQAGSGGESRDIADGVGTIQTHGRKEAGESGGGFYPNPHRGKKPHAGPDEFMGHGGQTEIAYHGTGQLGETDVEGETNVNAPTGSTASLADAEAKQAEDAPGDRNADLQGEGSPITDDAGPALGGMRGEGYANPASSGSKCTRELKTEEGKAIEVEELSGSAAAEARMAQGKQK